MEGVLEVGRGVGGEEEHRPVVSQDPGQLADVALGIVEVLDEVGGAGPVGSRPSANPSARAFIWATRSPRGPNRGRRRVDGLGAVVDPDHRPVGGQEPGRLEALAAAHVEHACPAPRRSMTVR